MNIPARHVRISRPNPPSIHRLPRWRWRANRADVDISSAGVPGLGGIGEGMPGVGGGVAARGALDGVAMTIGALIGTRYEWEESSFRSDSRTASRNASIICTGVGKRSARSLDRAFNKTLSTAGGTCGLTF